MEMMMMMRGDDGMSGVNLPPGFLFCPSDEELVLHFLYSKQATSLLPNNIIPDLDLSLIDPWQLNGKALSSGNQYYFYTKVNNNSDEKRSTENGYWKEIGVAEPIVSGVENKEVGMKKYLVFHILNIGEQGGGTDHDHDHETNWVMQEYHHHHSSSTTDAAASSHRWVLCRVYEKNNTSCQHGLTFSSDDHQDDDDDTGTELSWLDEVYLSLDDHLQEQDITMHYV